MTINSDIRLTELPSHIKQPAVAGHFYPGDPGELQQTVKDMLKQASVTSPLPKALVAPHAGYIYSGPIAANAYALLEPVKSIVKRVVLLGPAHRVYVNGMAISDATHFATPLGNIKVDTQLNKIVSRFPQVSTINEAFAEEHSLEVHLPFLQSVLDDFTLLPIVVGEANADQIAEVLESVWGGDETLIVISSDLSHFHDYQTATSLDKKTASHIKAMDYEQLGPQQACGCRPMSGLLKIAKQKNLQIDILDVRNSGDTAGNHERVVGYGAFSFHQADVISPEQKQLLLNISFESIKYGLTNNKPLIPDINEYPTALQESRGLFVTLKLDDNLRGCIGNTEAVYPLIVAAARNAYSAAYCDPRFQKLTEKEFKKIKLSISVLSPKREIIFDNEEMLLQQLRPGIDGLIISRGPKSATFLPAVWDTISTVDFFLSQLKLKAGIRPDQKPQRAWVYQSSSFSR